MPFDPTIPLQVQPVNPANNAVAGFINLGRNALAFQREQQTFGADVARSQALSQQAQTEADVSSQTAASRVSAAQSQAETALQQLSVAKLDAMRAHVANASQVIASLKSKPDLTQQDVIDGTFQVLRNSNAPPSAYVQALQGLPDTNGMAPDQAKQTLNGWLDQQLARNQDVAGQLSRIAPNPTFLNTGQKAIPVSSGAESLTGVAPGTAQGPGIQMQPPPTTPTINEKGQRGIIGSLDQGAQTASENANDLPERLRVMNDELGRTTDPADRAALQREIGRIQTQMQTGGQKRSGFIPTELPPGQQANIENNVNEMNRHFSSLQDASSGAALATGLIGNIKSLAPGAATGTESGRLAYVAGLLNTLGLGDKATGDLQKDTDLLEKNLAQLNLSTPASSDAARVLVTAARPHGTMNVQAIQEAADQVAGQVKANVAIRNFLSPYKVQGDYQGYQAARQKIEQVADPRIWQLQDMTQPERIQYMNRLSPQDKQKLVQNAQTLVQYGVIQ